MRRVASYLLAGIGLLLGISAAWLFVSSSRATVLPNSLFVYRGTLPVSAPTIPTSAPSTPKPKRAKQPVPIRKAESPTPVAPAPPPDVRAVLPSTPSSTEPVAALAITPSALPVPSTSATPPPAATEYLLISEVFTGSEASGDDEFIVLYNPTQQTINLAGWSISKRTSTGREERLLPQAKLATIQIASRAYIAFAHEGSSMPANGVAAYWAKSKTIAAKNNQIILYNPAGAAIDQSAWVEIPKGQVYIREPLMQGAEFLTKTPATKY